MPFSLPKSIAPGRCIVFLICLSLIIMLSTSSPKPEVKYLTYHDVQFIPRQNPLSPAIPSSPHISQTSTSTTTSPENDHSQPSKPANEGTSSTSTTSSTSSTSKQESPSTTPPPQTSSAPLPGQLSSIQSTGSDGSPTVIVVTVPASNTNTSPTATATSKEQTATESSGLGTGSIIGLSVAGGIALLGIVAFFVWKFAQRRRLAAYNDGEIKWPELNSETHVSGQGDHTVPQSISDGASVRDQSFRGAYNDGALGASQSQVDLYAADPYAVPPLPHLNPNQPYRDDPNAAPYHDNFSVPAFHESRPSSPSIRGEAIPMNQINRSRSPGPQGALYAGHGGRQSPGPHDAYGGGPGRQSPGPQDAYGGGYGRRSPGPNDAYGAR